VFVLPCPCRDAYGVRDRGGAVKKLTGRGKVGRGKVGRGRKGRSLSLLPPPWSGYVVLRRVCFLLFCFSLLFAGDPWDPWAWGVMDHLSLFFLLENTMLNADAWGHISKSSHCQFLLSLRPHDRLHGRRRSNWNDCYLSVS
jgi:hypothetical protein